MSDLETRLKRQLAAQSEQLPSSAFGIDAAVGRGRQRRRRAIALSSVGGMLAVAGLLIAGGALLESTNSRSETVFADQPQPERVPEPRSRLDPPEDAPVPQTVENGRPTLEIDPDSNTIPATQTTMIDGATTVGPGHGAETPTTVSSTAALSTTDRPEAPGAPTTEAATTGVRSTAAAIDRLPDGSVLFHSDHEGCADIEDGRAHADWIEGQAGSGLNEDGTPTYGFAFNSGDSTNGDIDWGFVERPDARSGRCVLSMALNRADTGDDAIRLFRRYDRNGSPLPAAAYYSAWLFLPEEVVFDASGSVDGRDVFGFWNVFQIKNDVAGGDDRRSMSAFSFNAGRLPDEPFMSLSVYSKVPCGGAEDCDQAFTIEQQQPIAIPTGRWVHFELYLASRSGADGELQVWQDGRLILDYVGPTERTSTVRRTWALGNLGLLHHRPSATVLVDDPLISTRPIHPELFD